MNLDDLAAELDRWVERGEVATLWWRDDDAVAASPALDALLALAESHDVPVALAVIPAALQRTLRPTPHCTILQHGYAHRNHAPADAKSCELGGTRPASAVAADLASGRGLLAGAFGDAFLPVVVPPWNRIDAAVVAALPALGVTGLSTFGPRQAPLAAPGVVQCNTHVDPVAWRAGRGFVGAPACLDSLAGHLAARREGRADRREPTGYLTHHLVFDDEAWAFTAALLAATRRHPGARWLGAREAFTCGRSA